MKIDFRSTFDQVDRLIRRPIKLADRLNNGHEFDNLINENRLQPQIVKEESSGLEAPLTALPKAMEEPKASLKLPLAQSEIPKLERLSSLSSVEKLTPSSVKPPTVISVRRIEGDLRLHTGPHVEKYKGFIQQAGQKHGIDPALGFAVASAESGFDAKAVSLDGHASKGLFQLLDSTGKDLFRRLEIPGKYDPFEPRTNVELGVGYLRYLHNLFSESRELQNSVSVVGAANSSSLEKLAVAAFNAGEGRVASAQMRATKQGMDASVYENISPYLPKTTREYVDRVLQYKSIFEQAPLG